MPAPLRIAFGFISLAGLFVGGGCVGSAHVEIAAADALEAVAAQTDRALAEYQGDLDAADGAREAEVIAAFVARTRRDAADDAKMNKHVERFGVALAKIREDRLTAWQRYQRASENVATLRETAGGLRRIGLDALRLDDEARRYFGAFLETRARAAAAPPSPSPASPAAVAPAP